MIPNKENTKRIILLDYSIFIHTGFAVWQKCPSIPATYTAMSSMLSTLNKVGASPDDVIMLAIDSRPSWRCAFSDEYKANRESLPPEIREQFAWLKDELNKQTNWIIIEPGNGIEADDLATTICKFFKDIPEIILCSSDHDWEQAWTLHDGVKIFSLHSKKWKIKPENYNLYQELAKMVHKETSDNLVSAVMNNEEYDKRLMLIDLTRLPEWVEKIIFDYLSNEELYNKNITYETVPIGKSSLQPRLDNLYNSSIDFISYETQALKTLMVEAKEKDKKFELKLKLQRAKERAIKKEAKLKIQSKTNRRQVNGKIYPSCI